MKVLLSPLYSLKLSSLVYVPELSVSQKKINLIWSSILVDYVDYSFPPYIRLMYKVRCQTKETCI